MLYLSARSISQAPDTKAYLENLTQVNIILSQYQHQQSCQHNINSITCTKLLFAHSVYADNVLSAYSVQKYYILNLYPVSCNLFSL